MRKSRFSETQIVGILRDAESGVPVPDLLRTHGVSKAIFFKRRSKYAALLHESELARTDPDPQLLHRPMRYDIGRPSPVI